MAIGGIPLLALLPPPRRRWPRRGNEPFVGGYRLLSPLGKGGTATVFLATPLAGGAPVAVKILRPGQAVSSCEHEFAMASAVDVACTAAPIEYGVATAGSYLVTDYLPDHRSGAGMLGAGMSLAALMAFGSALANTLTSVHGRGIVHCDVKPANLLVSDDDVRVIDFGIAQFVGERGPDDGFVRCSRGWAAPEQLRDAPLAPSADIFAWGSVLAYLSTGFHPFAGRDLTEWILRVGSGLPDLTGIHPGLDRVVRAALAHDPGDRPSAPELAAICRQVADRGQTLRPRSAASSSAWEDTPTASRSRGGFTPSG